MTKLFLVLAAIVVALVGLAAAKDSHDRKYLSIQDQYVKDYYPGGHDPKSGAPAPDSKVQQVFPAFANAKIGDSFRTERCISCHVPDLATAGPSVAAQRLVQDFLKYEPNAKQLTSSYHLKLVHPAVITQQYYDQWGQNSFATTDGFHPYTVPGDKPTDPKQTVALPGPLPSFLDPKSNGGKALGLDQVGCIVCHNGSRESLDDTAAHTNLIINPEYSFTEGAALYYQFCAQCHGTLGQGKIGPPLSNQDRLGFFNEDYYYRCIEYGATDFEHIGSVMPAWGSAASDWTYDKSRDKVGPKIVRQLSEDQVHVLVQFIRHWENYDTLP